MNLNDAPLLAGCVHVIEGLLNGVADGAHGDNDLLSVGSAIIVKGLIVGADLGVDLVHIFLYDAGNGVIELVAGFSGLEEDVGVLSGAVQDGVLRIEGTAAERVNSVPVEHLAEILIIPCLDLLDFMRGAEAIEEMEERHTTLDRREVSDSAEIHTLLRVIGAEHGITGRLS